MQESDSNLSTFRSLYVSFYDKLYIIFQTVFYRPHKCPDPKPRIATANNFVIRCARRAIGYQCKSMDRKFIHSRFCPVQTIRPSTDDGFFSCARFMVSYSYRISIKGETFIFMTMSLSKCCS